MTSSVNYGSLFSVVSWRNLLIIRNPLTSALVTLTAVIMALAAWFAIHTAVARDQENWIQTQSTEIESTISRTVFFLRQYAGPVASLVHVGLRNRLQKI